MASPTEDPTAELAAALARGERRALARAITLVESQNPAHRARARALLERLGPEPQTLRIGLTGTPGVGKSTFIERFGLMAIEAGRRVAVLAVDPSSARSGGSILGDKTRMERLSRAPQAYIRPSPAGSALGGVARRTRETIRLVEAAGFDTVIVETVGVGQSETLVAEMTDLFLLLIAPGGGDDLQGVKRGIMEMADLVVVNKADGALKPIAEGTRADYASALRLLRRRPGDPDDIPAALSASAATGDGLAAIWERLVSLDAWRQGSGWRAERRRAQAVTAFERSVGEGLAAAVRGAPGLAAAWEAARADVEAGRALPEAAADGLIAALAARLGAAAADR
ncbi:methylmalonyl Co-A mutase-associated GTPase MeaB [Paralimibaculum aggregatum]|uniref:Methylmalonyl Co-A mutase-associated GTPase MeaB n=1 Tax=Paralimibaculum aggregatum TaxID=3036245 RepID=A0ABQ6LNK3_9RHOB|nr:methylmalonyl Co-A mutase-associated GTPase MeaB [Limibaculum sp. NKW23]GMG84795.1 methylmalonyl Co-A mutase-associated GTPase MeaB [Limibaculum sp. NKW23]